MARQVFAAIILLFATAGFAPGQDSFAKNFRPFKGIVPGIDFFSASRGDIAPFESPVKEVQAKLSAFLGKELARGALVICTTLDQKDSVSERRLLKMGYRWALILLTPEATRQQVRAQSRVQEGGRLPPALMEQVQNPLPELKAAGTIQQVASSVRQIGNAILMTTLAPEMEFRSSRVDDVSRSPLRDWLDVGLVSYATGDSNSNLEFLQEHLEEAFPLEDVISMSRPFVLLSEDGPAGSNGAQLGVFSGGVPGAGGAQAGVVFNGGSGTGGTQPQRQASPGQNSGGTEYVIRQSTSPGGEHAQAPVMMAMPKDVQDRTLFDSEASSFFAFAIERLGIQKCRALIQASLDKKDLRDFLTQDDMLGPDFDAIERDWQNWVKNQKEKLPEKIQLMKSSGKPGPTP